MKNQHIWVRLLQRIEFPQACIDQGCEELNRTPDLFSTGDSPEGFECGCWSAEDCPLYIEIEDNPCDVEQD